MANSYVEYTTAGSGTNGLSQTTFTAPTKFLSINDIRIKGYNGSAWTELTISARGTTTVTLSAAPTAYSKIRVFRSSTTEALIDFQNGSRLAESDLDTAYRQSLFVAQEVAEDADPEGGSGIGNIFNSQLAGGITQDKLAGGITNAQLAGSIADDKLASGVGTSANNLVKLDGTAKLPAVDGSQLTNVSAGKVLQVKTTSDAADGSVITNTDLTSLLTLSITPSLATSKIIILAQTISKVVSNTNAYVDSKIFRGDIASGTIVGRYFNGVEGISSNTNQYFTIHHNVVDAPNTTSSLTYTFAFGKGSGGTTSVQHTSGRQLTLMEIAP